MAAQTAAPLRARSVKDRRSSPLIGSRSGTGFSLGDNVAHDGNHFHRSHTSCRGHDRNSSYRTEITPKWLQTDPSRDRLAKGLSRPTSGGERSSKASEGGRRDGEELFPERPGSTGQRGCFQSFHGNRETTAGRNRSHCLPGARTGYGRYRIRSAPDHESK